MVLLLDVGSDDRPPNIIDCQMGTGGYAQNVTKFP